MFKVDCSKIEARGGFVLVWQEEQEQAFNVELMPWQDYFESIKAGVWDDVDVAIKKFDGLNEAINWIEMHMPYIYK